MQKDEELFNKHEGDLCADRLRDGVLRIYQWEPRCISLGYSKELEKLLNLGECKNQGWDIVKRVTGGGIVFHNEQELTYSLFLNKDHPALPQGILPSCNFIAKILVKTLQEQGITEAALAEHKGQGSTRGTALCFARPTKYEIVVGEHKVIGNAQKRGRRSFFQHGSICIKKNAPETQKCLLGTAPGRIKGQPLSSNGDGGHSVRKGDSPLSLSDNSIGLADIKKDLDVKRLVEALIHNFSKTF